MEAHAPIEPPPTLPEESRQHRLDLQVTSNSGQDRSLIGFFVAGFSMTHLT